MFLGHFAVGFAAKRLAPSTSLGVSFAACQWLDLVWPVFLSTGLEEVRIRPGDTAFTPLEFVSYPWTHSLLFSCLWAIVFGVVYGFRTRKWAAARVLALIVVSHWILDWITHRPDLPLFPGSARFGLGLWNHPPATILIELKLYACAVLVYVKTTRARTRAGWMALLALVAFQVLIYAANVLGPPPAAVEPIIWLSFAAWLFPLWAAWVDHRQENRVDPIGQPLS